MSLSAWRQENWPDATPQGKITTKHLQGYLDGFVSRFNRRRLRHVGKIFHRLAERIVLELRDRVGIPGAAAGVEAPGPAVAARDGLAGLGFDDAEITLALADAPGDLDAEGLIRHALARLRKG